MTASIAITDGIAVITMDDGKANAVNPALVAALNACLDQAEREAKAVVLAGRAQRFSGGFDLKMMAASPREEVRALVTSGGRLAMRLYGFPMPVVAACTGHCVAMGVFLLLACDIRIGTRGGFKIGANETAIGMSLPIFAVELLKARLDPRALTKASILAHLYDPESAVTAGYFDSVEDAADLLPAAIRTATELAALPGTALATTKRLMRQHTLDVVMPTL
ncbi:MAG: crotonase/enoyl-CoA hydratase family protein [Alphaproteobacteria bacterium]|nr:crotonase/enoyl-CoA hydratase family protein [Alphaproteobacteria bacterium]